ncbi:MAG: energy transducer TonB [Pyrinomonadaceae bacterium]
MNITIRFLICLLLINVGVFAQDDPKWTRIESANKEFSFAVPSNFSYIFDKKGITIGDGRKWAELSNLRSIGAYVRGTTMFVESYDVSNAKSAVSYFARSMSGSEVGKISFENFVGVQIISKKDYYRAFYYFASKKNIYLIAVTAREEANDSIARFLDSVRLNGKVIFTSATEKVTETAQTRSMLNLDETEIRVIPESEEIEKSPISKTETTKSGSAKAIVVFKPYASYTERAREARLQGSVRIKIELLANGSVGDVKVVKGLGHGLTENVIRAAKRIKFIPEMVDGVPVTKRQTFEYAFSIY